MKASDLSVLQRIMKEADVMSMGERRAFYEKLAALLLLRYLRLENLVEKGVTREDCMKLKDTDVETASGIAFMFDIRGSRWQIQLQRQEECMHRIEENPDLLSHPDCFKMDITVPAKVANLNHLFYS